MLYLIGNIHITIFSECYISQSKRIIEKSITDSGQFFWHGNQKLVFGLVTKLEDHGFEILIKKIICYNNMFRVLL